MKKLVIELCCVIALAACGNGKEQKTVEEDATAKALLQGRGWGCCENRRG